MKINLNDDYNNDYYDDSDQQIDDYGYNDDLESYWEQIEKEANKATKATKKHKDKKDKRIERVYSEEGDDSDDF